MKKITIEEEGRPTRTIKVVQYAPPKNPDGSVDEAAMRGAFQEEFARADLVFGEVTKGGGIRRVIPLKDREASLRVKRINLDPLRGKLVFTDRRWTKKWEKYRNILVIQAVV